MEIYFDNDGSYGSAAVGIPVMSNKRPIGFVCSVTADRVTCRIWDQYVAREQILMNLSTTEQDIRSIGIYTD